jgi:hypothetical protein
MAAVQEEHVERVQPVQVHESPENVLRPKSKRRQDAEQTVRAVDQQRISLQLNERVEENEGKDLFNKQICFQFHFLTGI